MSKQTERADTATVALILGLRTPFYLTIQRGAEAEAARQHVHLLVDAPPDFRAELQNPLIERYIEQHVDAIVITPCDSQGVVASLRKAHEAGIQVITVDAFIGDGDYIHGAVTFPLAYIGSNNVQGGRMAAEALIRVIGGSGTIFVQSLMPGVSSSELREEGFKQVLDETNGAVTLAGINFDGGSIEMAREQSLATLRNVPHLAGAMGTGDYSSKGLVRALRESGLNGKIRVVRFDASQQAIEELREGITDAVIAQRPYEMGRAAIEYAARALQGETSSLQKYVDTGFVLIDRQNMDTPEIAALVYVG